MSFLRPHCDRERVTPNEWLAALRNNAPVAVAGVVLVRQRPGSAKGVVFVTLEDETSICNIVVWPPVLETHRAIVMGARLMLVRGRIQSADNVIHVVADRIEDKTSWLSLLTEEGALLSNPLARADEIAHPGHDRRDNQHRHPRNVRIIPKSRDFH